MREIVTEVYLDASPEATWRVLSDLPGYAGWNPFITDAAGEIRADSRLQLTFSPPGGKPIRLHPRVLAARPGRELRWLGRLLLPGMFDGEHYFLLEPDGTGTRLMHGERFAGILVPFLWHSIENLTRNGFEAMNSALRTRLRESE